MDIKKWPTIMKMDAKLLTKGDVNTDKDVSVKEQTYYFRK
jgi:hypothetical protein